MNMNIKTNSKKVNEGDTFVAIKGNVYDGHDFIEEAIKRGASNIICEYGEYSVPYITVPSTKEYLNNYLHDTYYKEIKDITLIGVTGTNGKTTSCYLLYELLKLLNVKCAYIGTIGFYMKDKVRDLDNTTPELLELYEIFLECKRSNTEVIVMEVSSHALELDRVYGLKYDYVVFTNLTEDHLSFHNTMEEYLEAKMKLFARLKDNGISISNKDDSYSKYFIDKNTITYGMRNSDYKIIDYKLNIDKTLYEIEVNKKKYKVRINMPGRYNIYNSIISLIVLNDMGYNINIVIALLNKVTLPKGRMEIVKHNKSVIIIDYAHTPDAIKNALTNGNEFKKSKLYTIVGCGGNRDKGKRKEMGLIATNLSDYVIFTNDNPRDEDEAEIVNDIISGLRFNNYEIILNRKDAIRKGIDLLKGKDILFILGKGHEDYQVIKGVKNHFSDKEEVIKYLNERN